MVVTNTVPAKARPGAWRTPLSVLAEGGAPLISFGFVLAIWTVVSLSQIVPESIFPSPWSVWFATGEMWGNGRSPMT